MPRSAPRQLLLLPDQAPAQLTNRHCYRLAGQSIEYTLNRSARRRSITLTIDEQGLRVGATSRASQQRIETVLATHAHWIVRKLAEWQARRPAPFEWTAGARIMLLGEPLVLVPDAAATSITCVDGQLRAPLVGAGTDALAAAVLHWLRETANHWFAQRVGHFAPILAVAVPVIRLSNARTRWGTCHPHGRVHLNWRLIHMPPALIDYVVVHELAHLHEANHSPRFWRRVEAVLPDHVQRRRVLRAESHRYLLP
jgi:predicted metal-dependent hydrolase